MRDHVPVAATDEGAIRGQRDAVVLAMRRATRLRERNQVLPASHESSVTLQTLFLIDLEELLVDVVHVDWNAPHSESAL